MQCERVERSGNAPVWLIDAELSFFGDRYVVS